MSSSEPQASLQNLPPAPTDIAADLCEEALKHLETMLPLVLRMDNGDQLYVSQFIYRTGVCGACYFLEPVLIERLSAKTGRTEKCTFKEAVGEANYLTWGVNEILNLRVQGLELDLPFARVYREDALFHDGADTARTQLAAWKAGFAIHPTRLRKAREDYCAECRTRRPKMARKRTVDASRTRPVVRRRTSATDGGTPEASANAGSPHSATAPGLPDQAPATVPELPSGDHCKSAVASRARDVDGALLDADRLRERLGAYVTDRTLVNDVVGGVLCEALAVLTGRWKPQQQ